jgi:hypothetical protein
LRRGRWGLDDLDAVRLEHVVERQEGSVAVSKGGF